MNNLILISTQFQLLNAVELIDDHLKGQEFKAMLLIKNKNHFNQIKKIAIKNNIDIISVVKYQTILQYFSLFFQSFKFKKIETLIIGNCQDNLVLFLLKLLKFKNLYAVDDGNIIDTHHIKPNIHRQHLPLKFYTIFNLKSNAYYDFLLNDFKKLKKNKSNQTGKNSEKFFFIGQPLSEQGLIDKESFIRIMEKINNKFHDNIIYILHPSEKEDKFISNGKIKTIRLNTSIEDHLISLESLPSKVVGFYSTALSSLSKIFNSEEVEINFIDIEKHQKIKKTYFGKPHGFNHYQYLKKNVEEILI
jgi:hypothetical protein